MHVRIIDSDIDKIAVDKLNNLLELLNLPQSQEGRSSIDRELDASQVVFTKSFKNVESKDHFIIIYNEGDDLDRSLLDNEMCLGIFFADKSVEENYLNIKNAIEGLRALETQKQLLFKMNSVMEGLVGQVENIKEMHRNMAPFRSEKLRGVGITSRFCAGTSNGGEFFDFFKIGGEVWIVSLHASSYMLIGNFLSLIETWKLESNIDMTKVISNLESKKDDFSEYGDASILIARIKLSDLSAEVLNIGDHELLNKDGVVLARNGSAFPSNYNTSTQEVQLNKGEGLLLLSPGFFKNIEDKIDGEEYLTFVKKNWAAPVEFISELTFQTKKGYNENDFLPNDQTILMIEVDKNAISKI
ncbi:hypothetical protein [Halobacteriovorax sp. YZS-1-1]|uniref:hypothetical protein n=1 Tax=unclassified Halobacteriovorax TaxID=2639665 RepID=UPI00399BA6A4